MNVKDLTKEQKQRIALGGIAAVAFVAIIFFGIKVSLSSIAVARQELDELAGKIESADRTLAKGSQVRKDYGETIEVLKEYLHGAPPVRNYYSWATEVIHERARQANLEVDSIDEQSRPRSTPSAGKDKALTLEPYSLRIVAHGGYGALKQFLELIEKEHPLARVVTVDVSTGSNPEMHDVQLVVQWPFNLGSVADTWPDMDKNKGLNL